MKVTRTLLAGLLSAISAPVLAQDLPRYPVESYCQEVADVSGGSSMIYNGCIDMEQTSYNNLKSKWGRVPARSRSYCDEVARVVGGSYSTLEGCVQMENDAASSTPSFEY